MKILKIGWSLLGVLILLWNLYWFTKVKILNDYGIVGNAIKYSIGIYILIFYLMITIIDLLSNKK